MQIVGLLMRWLIFQSEYHIFVEEFKRNPGIIWIMKPAAKSQGRGIFLFRKLKDITDWKKVSHYENTPMQHTEIFRAVNIENLSQKCLMFFSIFAQHIDCCLSEYPQFML